MNFNRPLSDAQVELKIREIIWTGRGDQPAGWRIPFSDQWNSQWQLYLPGTRKKSGSSQSGQIQGRFVVEPLELRTAGNQSQSIPAQGNGCQAGGKSWKCEKSYGRNSPIQVQEQVQILTIEHVPLESWYWLCAARLFLSTDGLCETLGLLSISELTASSTWAIYSPLSTSIPPS